MPEFDVVETIEARSKMLQLFPQRTVPDLCEMGVVCNHTDLLFLTIRHFMHPMRALSKCPRSCGRKRSTVSLALRALSTSSIVCAERTSRVSRAGFISWWIAWIGKLGGVLDEKGIPVSRDGNHGLLYNPSHLLASRLRYLSCLHVCWAEVQAPPMSRTGSTLLRELRATGRRDSNLRSPTSTIMKCQVWRQCCFRRPQPRPTIRFLLWRWVRRSRRTSLPEPSLHGLWFKRQTDSVLWKFRTKWMRPLRWPYAVS